ncbi:hypothetical protein BGW38_010625 [Lunasporangiospora selenospora]|uniref:Uncharacterized protein n=1 Tax=Lunasporangiospora selenospora TaxID=979761 RepID=A0A9P6FWG5_9FUNG|nr:hypothetical protein BGW38_010625 [Lunasporangiospora selenospora]
MIDIMGGPCTGKTMLLYAIIISTILPKAWKHSRSRPALILNNKPAQSVVFLDLDQGFSAERLKILLCRRIREKLQGQELSYSEFASRQEQKQDQEQGLNLEEEDWDIEVDQHLNLEAERVAMDKGEVNQHDPTSTRGVESNATTTTTNATLPHQEPYIPIDIDSPEITAKIEHLALSCLDAVHVFRPRDAVSAVVILRTLDQYMAQQTKKSTLDQESLSVASCSNNKQPSTENDTVRARNKTRLRRTCPPFGAVNTTESPSPNLFPQSAHLHLYKLVPCVLHHTFFNHAFLLGQNRDRSSTRPTQIPICDAAPKPCQIPIRV